MVMEKNNRETEGTGSGSDRVGQSKKGQKHVPGDDPVAATDPNAEGASLATDGRGLGQVDELRREADSETSDRNRANDEGDETYNDGQKTVQGKNQKGPEDKLGRSAGGNEGSKGQNGQNKPEPKIRMKRDWDIRAIDRTRTLTRSSLKGDSQVSPTRLILAMMAVVLVLTVLRMFLGSRPGR